MTLHTPSPIRRWGTGLVYKNEVARGSGGGWVFNRVGGSKALEHPPLFIIPRVSWVGHLPHPLSLFTEALSGWVLLPLFALSLCRHHAINLFVV